MKNRHIPFCVGQGPYGERDSIESYAAKENHQSQTRRRKESGPAGMIVAEERVHEGICLGY
jgi:xanthine dehydrogenase molybdopterin-binding subunit B